MCNSTYRLGSGVTNYLHGSENVKSDSTFHLAKANTSSAPLYCYSASNPYGKVPNGSKAAPPLFHKTILQNFKMCSSKNIMCFCKLKVLIQNVVTAILATYTSA